MLITHSGHSNTLTWLIILHLTQSVFLVPLRNKEELKVFRDDETPPEETVELWMGGGGAATPPHQMTSALRHSDNVKLMNDLHCFLNSSSSRIRMVENRKNACPGGSCDKGKSADWLLALCVKHGCGDVCKTAKDWSSCVFNCATQTPAKRHSDLMAPEFKTSLTQSGKEQAKRSKRSILPQLLKRHMVGGGRVKKESSRLELLLDALHNIQQTLPSINTNWPTQKDPEAKPLSNSDRLASTQTYFDPETLFNKLRGQYENWLTGNDAMAQSTSKRGAALLAPMEKRYRLQLYDCLASYCDGLSSEERASCMMENCHRF